MRMTGSTDTCGGRESWARVLVVLHMTIAVNIGLIVAVIVLAAISGERVESGFSDPNDRPSAQSSLGVEPHSQESTNEVPTVTAAEVLVESGETDFVSDLPQIPTALAITASPAELDESSSERTSVADVGVAPSSVSTSSSDSPPVSIEQSMSVATTSPPDIPDPPANIPERCTIGVVTEPRLKGPAAKALASLNEVMPDLRLVIADVGPITVSYGGEWPVDHPPLGWTAPDRRTILINPDHPLSATDVALAEMIVHELGHVLINTSHTNDGTVLDPRLDGEILIGDADQQVLGNLSCGDFGF